MRGHWGEVSTSACEGDSSNNGTTVVAWVVAHAGRRGDEGYTPVRGWGRHGVGGIIGDGVTGIREGRGSRSHSGGERLTGEFGAWKQHQWQRCLSLKRTTTTIWIEEKGRHLEIRSMPTWMNPGG